MPAELLPQRGDDLVSYVLEHADPSADVYRSADDRVVVMGEEVGALGGVFTVTQGLVERYGEDRVREPERLHATGLAEVRSGPVGLLRDLQDLHVLATLVQTTWTVIAQGAQGLRDRELLEVATAANAETSRQLSWLNTRMKAAAPQALIVDP